MSNVFYTLEEDSGKHMVDLVDDGRRRSRKWSMRMIIAKMVDGFLMVIGISCYLILMQSCKDAAVADSVPVAATRDSERPLPGSASGTARSRGKDHGFSEDERVFPTVASWRTSAPKDEMPAKDTYFAKAVTILNTHRTPIQKQPEALLCLVGLSRKFFLGDDVYPTFLHDDDRDMDFFNLIRTPNPTKVKTSTRPRAAHEVPLLTVIVSRVIEIEDPATTTNSSGIPSTIERSPLDFANENPSQQSTGGNRTEDQGQKTVSPEVPPPENVTTTGVAPEAGLAEEIAAMGRDCRHGSQWKSLASMGLGTGSTFHVPTSQETPIDVSGPDPLSFANPQSIPTENVTQYANITYSSVLNSDLSRERSLLEIQNRRIPPLPSWSGHPKAYISRSEAETDMKKSAKAKNAELGKELENLRSLFLDLQVSNDRLSQQVSTLQAQVTREEKLKVAFEEFKQYEDDRVEKCCAEINARLNALSIDFDEELYPRMLTAIAGRRWVIGHGLCLEVIKCGESIELRQVFADVVSAGISKGMSEGLEYGVEHGKANLDLEAIEAYDPEAETKYVASLHALRDLKYPMVDQLELLKDAPIDVVMESLHLESDYGEDAPQWIRELHPSSSQLKIPIYPEVRDPKDPWAFKEEILLADAIAANESRAEKKKKFRVVCRTHGIGSMHHARSDGVPVSVPTISPQGLAILLANAATQIETSEDGASPRNKSIAAIGLEKVVAPLIEPAIKGFAAAPAVLKPERLKVDKHDMSEPMSYYLID
nr:transposase (putative), gypsy type [Tanacetum cinerariifolium]